MKNGNILKCAKDKHMPKQIVKYNKKNITNQNG